MICDGSKLVRQKDATVQAIADLTGVPYRTCDSAFKRAGRRNKRIYGHMIKKVLKELGFSVGTINPESLVSKYPAPHNKLQGVTTHHPERFREVWDAVIGDRSVILFTADRITGYKDGKVLQGEMRGRPFRVHMLWPLERS